MNESIRKTLLVLAVILIIAIAGCGQGSRELTSVKVTPNVADAQSFPGGQVQFTALGTFSAPPSPAQVTSPDIMWCIGDAQGHCAGFINTGAIVSPGTGLAQCNVGFSGTVTVLAGQPQGQSPPDIGPQLRIFGAAQLTCP